MCIMLIAPAYDYYNIRFGTAVWLSMYDKPWHASVRFNAGTLCRRPSHM